MSYMSLTFLMRWAACSPISYDYDTDGAWPTSVICDYRLLIPDPLFTMESQFSCTSFNSNRLDITTLAQNSSHLFSSQDISSIYLELEKSPSMNNFKMTGLHGESSDSLTYLYPEYNSPRYYLPISGSYMSTQNTSMVAASFGMQYLINFQQKAWADSKELVTYNGIDITEESFKRFQAITSRSRFHHHSDHGKTLELIDDSFFIGINYNDTKVPHTYRLVSAILHKEAEHVLLNALERSPKKLYIDWVDSITSSGGLSTKTIPLPKNKIFYEEAYPCLNGQPLKEFIEDYLNSDAAVLLLYGPPGTGKTSLLKQIMQYANESCLITYNKDIAAMDTLFSHFYDCNERFLIIEDADTYISSRAKDGNDVMKKLLNVTDGLTAREEKKVIFTTNLTNLNDVDEALLREGRCYATLHVDQLSAEQAQILLDAMGHTSINIDESIRKISLANLYSLISGRKVDQSVEQVSSGFGLGKR